MPLTIGSRLGPYEVLSLVGAGGMGEVYRARDTRLDRDVAIKVLPDAFAGDPNRQRRFEQEARSIASLNHPHICQIYDVGPGYLVLEYLTGEAPRGPMSPGDAVRLAIQLASALEAAHQRGILHRDLKPSNVMVDTRSGAGKLLDFGLAKLTDGDADATRTVDGAVVGTAAYMSPEQAEGVPVDARSDVFALGAVLYELIAGRRAFDGTTSMQVLDAVRRTEPQPLAGPAPLERVVRRCLAKRPDDRFQTMTAVRHALEDAAGALGASGPDAKPSIAVLPFANMSADPENEYFSDGLAEEIINALTQVPGLKVIARTSAFAFKGKNEDVRRIAETLGVAHVLEGSVRKAGNRIRVTAQLIAAADGSHVWSERYDRELADVFAVQDDIAASITGALRITLSATANVARRHTPNLEAYESYLKAVYHAEKWTPDSMVRAQEQIERAIALDPTFALAHAELAHTFARLAIYGLMSPRDAMPRVRVEARKALDIDPSLPEGHAMLGMVAAMFDYDWPEAERRFRFALAQPGAAPRLHRYYAHYCLLPLRRFREGIEHHTIVVNADPLNSAARAERAVFLIAAGHNAEASEELRQLIDLDATFWFPYFLLSSEHALAGRFEDALPLAERAHSLAPWFVPAIGVIAAVLKHFGETDRADVLARRLSPDGAYADPIGGAMFHLLCGELDAAVEWIEKAIDERQPAVMFFLNGTAKRVRSSHHWPALARLMNLPERDY